MAYKGKSKRANGQGTIYKEKGRKALTAEISNIFFHEGERYCKRLRKRGFRTKTEAQEWLDKQKQELDEWQLNITGEALQAFAQKAKQGKLTFSDVWKKYEEYHFPSLTKKTQKQYRLHREKCKRLDNLPYSDITALEYQECINKAGDTYDQKKKMKTVLTGLATFAIRQGWIKENLARVCILPEKPITHKKVFSHEEICLLWDYYNGKVKITPTPHKNGKMISNEDYRRACAALLIMLYSGMRPGELLNIKAANVDMIHHEISGAATKTRESKKNPICFSTAISGIITDYILGEKNQFAAVEMETLRKQVDSLFNKLGMKHHELSACRTTFATFFSENETDEEPLRRLMRHTDIKTTRDNYDKSSTKAAHVALEQLHGIYTQTLEERIEEYDRQIAELEKAKNSLRKEKMAL